MTDQNLITMLEQMALLMEINGENDFKIRAFQNGARVLEKSGIDVHSAVADGSIAGIKGIGKGLQELLREYVQHGDIAEYHSLKASVPAGVLQLTELRGVGGKKARSLYEQLGIASIGELEYACRENRLVELKGFGAKTQESILKSIIEWNNAQGKLHQDKAFALAEDIRALLLDAGATRVEFSGELRRACEIITHIVAVVECSAPQCSPHTIAEKLSGSVEETSKEGIIVQAQISGINLQIHCVSAEEFMPTLLRTTGGEAMKELHLDIRNISSEEEAFQKAGLPFIPPELRDNAEAVERAKNNELPALIEKAAMRAMLHIHTTWSDGMNSIREMALESKRLGFEYIAICDHSRTAVYANGLSIERVLEQHKEIDKLNSEGLGITILKGIESDILSDGSLDYPDEILERFDMVVASVHSAFKLPKEQQTERIIRALHNPYTTILGHPTGRLLLARSGYELDMERILLAAAETGTVVELNANPYRFDLDWRWHQYAVQHGVTIAINPDSHETGTLQEVFLGVGIARKGMLRNSDVLNTMNLEDFRTFTTQLRTQKLAAL